MRLSVIVRLVSSLLIRFMLGSSGIYLSATCDTNLERAIDELRKLRTLHELILNAADQGIYGLDLNAEGTFQNAATVDFPGKWSSQKQ